MVLDVLEITNIMYQKDGETYNSQVRRFEINLTIRIFKLLMIDTSDYQPHLWNEIWQQHPMSKGRIGYKGGTFMLC